MNAHNNVSSTTELDNPVSKERLVVFKVSHSLRGSLKASRFVKGDDLYL